MLADLEAISDALLNPFVMGGLIVAIIILIVVLKKMRNRDV